MAPSPNMKGDFAFGAARHEKKPVKLGMVSGVYIPVFLNIMSILMFLRFGVILGQIGFVGMIGLLILAYSVNLLTALSLSAIASNGEVKGGGAYYLISRSLGPEFGGSIGLLFYLAQVLNAAMNVVGLIDCIRGYVGPEYLPQGYWMGYGLQTGVLVACTCMSLLGSGTFSKASNGLLAVLGLAVISIPVSAMFREPFIDDDTGVTFTGLSLTTLAGNFLPHAGQSEFRGFETFRALFGILFPATSGIFAGASMSGDLREPSKMIPTGTLWAMLTTFIVYCVVIMSLAMSVTHESLLANPDVIATFSLSSPLILAGECAVALFSSLMGIIGASKQLQALSRDRLLPGLSVFGWGSRSSDEPMLAIFLTYAVAQIALLADLNQIATLIAMGYQMTFFVMNLACFLLKIGSAPNFRPGFKFFSWQAALCGSLMSAMAMFFIEETYAATAICALIVVFLLIHYLCPPKKWGDVSQNLIYHQVRKYLLRLKPEHIKFWRPQIILLVNNPRRQTRLIQFCNSMKKGSLYILGHVIVTDDFSSGVEEAKVQQEAWTNYISESSRIKAFVQLTMSPTLIWGMRNVILSAGLGGMRPNIAIIGFYNMDELRRSRSKIRVPDIPSSPTSTMKRPRKALVSEAKRRRGDTSARLLEGVLPTDVIRTEGMMSATDYMTILEDLTLKYRLNVAVGHGFETLETPRKDGSATKKYIDLWPIQMSAEVNADGKNFLTTNFDTYTLILQLGHILGTVQTWRKEHSLRVMVFVEYESEVEEESSQVRALLEKLRIDAEVIVFWLASGHLHTYELIVNGTSTDIDWEIIVNEGLKDEQWWNEMQSFRGRDEPMSASQEADQLAHILDSTAGRPGVYNPHEEIHENRRTSLADIPEIQQKNPPLAALTRMGVNMGIHTQHLIDDVLQDSSSDDSSSDGESDDEHLSYPLTRTVSDQAVDMTETRQPLLAGVLRRRSSRRRGMSRGLSDNSLSGRRRPSASIQDTPSYGTIAEPPEPLPTTKPVAKPEMQRTESAPPQIPIITEQFASPRSQESVPKPEAAKPTEAFPALDPEIASQVPSPDKLMESPMPSRPALSRQSSAVKFSSRPVPETKITRDGDDSKISFAATPVGRETVKPERPTFSRQSSAGKFSSRPVPETKLTADEENPRTISFAETPTYQPNSTSHSRHHSRTGSGYSVSGQPRGDASINISSLLESYRFDDNLPEDENGSAYSTQSWALSFNDLPSRAQHMVLNELMRQNSKHTAVIMTTLPVPSEGTCLDEEATVRYLSDVEVLANELPPMLMVLSNNMTVTVNL